MTNLVSPPTNRLDELETVLKWEGRLDNARIRSLWGVQKVWASRLLSELIERMGSRAYRPQKHGPLLMAAGATSRKASPDEYLRLLSSTPGGFCSAESQIHDARIDLTAVSPAVFAIVRYAAQQRIALQMTYRSMSSPQGSVRLVFPHSVVRAPRRWHMRAWCCATEEFRDFVLARVQTAQLVDVTVSKAVDDDAVWNRLVDLVLIAHPKLTVEQQALIAEEYFPGASARRLRVREALAGYVIQDLRVATDATLQAPPEYQLLLASKFSKHGFMVPVD
jgi:predicted DNA-binding transcriptional regulator YafY